MRPCAAANQLSPANQRGPLLALFFISSAFLLLLIASTKLMPFGAWWPGLIALILLTSLTPLSLKLSVPGALFVTFCLTLLLQAILLAPTYDPKAIYLSFSLLLPFLIFSNRLSTLQAFKFAACIAALISYAGLIFWLNGLGFGWGNGVRADIVFGTPNTFATFINIFLAPLLAYYLLGKGGRGVFALLILLFTTLLSAQSRGGYLALAASMGFFATIVGPKTLLSNKERISHILLGFTSSVLMLQWFTRSGAAVWEGSSRLLATATEGDMPRMELYAMALQTLKEHFPNGTGTFTFKYYLEMYKPMSWQDRHTSFVHNDYLQLAVENGLLGIGLFLAVIITLYFLLFKHRSRIVHEHRLPLILSATGASSMLAHALVDFPFYVPVFQAILGAYLGIINRHLVEMGSVHYEVPALPKWWLPPGISLGFVKGISVLALISWLGLPFFAKIAAGYGLSHLIINNYEGAVYWHSLASMLQPRSSEYYWREGIIWRDLAVTRHDPRMMEKSDALFAKGAEVNPLETINLLHRVGIHRQHQDLFTKPTSREQVASWMLRAKQLDPIGIDTQVEYIRFLAFYGPHEDAVSQAETLLRWRPDSKFAQRLLGDIKAMPSQSGIKR